MSMTPMRQTLELSCRHLWTCAISSVSEWCQCGQDRWAGPDMSPWVPHHTLHRELLESSTLRADIGDSTLHSELTQAGSSATSVYSQCALHLSTIHTCASDSILISEKFYIQEIFLQQ